MTEGKKQLDAAREALRYLREPVPLPREVEKFFHYFCGDATNPQALTDTQPLRIAFYRAVATVVRAYADIAQDLGNAGYSDAESAALKKEVEFYGDTRNAIIRHRSLGHDGFNDSERRSPIHLRRSLMPLVRAGLGPACVETKGDLRSLRIPPGTRLKIYLYGYLNRIQSSRRLEREARRNIELMWLTGRLAPDFKTIADFRKDNGASGRYAPSSSSYAVGSNSSPVPLLRSTAVSSKR